MLFSTRVCVLKSLRAFISKRLMMWWTLIKGARGARCTIEELWAPLTFLKPYFFYSLYPRCGYNSSRTLSTNLIQLLLQFLYFATRIKVFVLVRNLEEVLIYNILHLLLIPVVHLSTTRSWIIIHKKHFLVVWNPRNLLPRWELVVIRKFLGHNLTFLVVFLK